MSVLRYFIFFSFLLLISCFQEKETFIPDTTLNDPAFLYSQSLDKIKRFELPITENTFFFTPDNKNFLKIPGGSLTDAEGNVFTGKATLEIFTMESIGDLIAFGKIPYTSNGPVSTQNLFYFSIKSKDTKLTINPDLPIEWYSSTETSSSPYHLYLETTTEDDQNVWTPQFTSNFLPWSVKINENQINGYGCVFPVLQSGWFVIGADKNNSSEFSVYPCIETSQNFNKNNTIGFIINKDQKIIIPLTKKEASALFCNELFGVAKDSGIKFVLLSYQDDGQYYFGQLSTLVRENETYQIKPEVKPLKDILSFLRAL